MSTSTRFQCNAEVSSGGAETRTYVREECVVFSKTDEPFGGLSNMAAGYPLMVRGVRIRTAEALYQACRFPHLPDVQRLIIGEASPMTAKMRGKPFRDQSRADWDRVRVKIMRWTLRVKLAQNFEKFAALLEDTADRPIVEFSKKDDFWGAKPSEPKRLTGANVLGRLLMELRETVRSSSRAELESVAPLEIPDFLFLGNPIGVIEASKSTPVLEPDLLTEPKRGVSSAHEGHAPVYEVHPNNNESQASSDLRHGSKEHGRLSNRYPRRLIEVDLPIRRISAHSRREKSIRHGHISTLHIWWARRPLAACRAVICAALWPDPVDVTEKEVEEARKDGRALQSNVCPPSFHAKAREEMLAWTSFERQMLLSEESRVRFEAARKNPRIFEDSLELRGALLDFIADFSNWDNSTIPEYLATARALTRTAHEALGGHAGTRPLVVDPFAGGGSIPLEAIRVGADTFASDLNPIPVLLNKVALEYIPKYGQRLADEVRTWGEWVQRKAEEELAEFYPKDANGATSIAYLWARTIRCEGPGCGAEVPLFRSLWLAKKGRNSTALRIVPDVSHKSVDFEIIQNASAQSVSAGTIRRGSVTCPCCGFSTPVTSVRTQLRARKGGAADARLIAVRYDNPRTGERTWRLSTRADIDAAQRASTMLEQRKGLNTQPISLVPDEPLPPQGTLGFRVQNYGMLHWGDLFSPRQALSLTTIGRLVREANIDCEAGLAAAVRTCLALAVDRLADFNASLCVLNSVGGRGVVHVFGRQAVPIVWDFMETNPFNTEAANWKTCFRVVDEVIEFEKHHSHTGHVERADATRHPLPDDSAAAFITDPPYYDAVPYADLSDFFYVWLKRVLPGYAQDDLTPKTDECIVDETKGKDKSYFERTMGQAMAEGRRVLTPDGVGVIVFAHKSTSGWEAQLQAMVDAGWTVTGSWPIDTERPGRLRAQDSAALSSSVHIVVRPRMESNSRSPDVGDWRDMLTELPRRIHEWMPRLAEEGVVGADAIFACLGPALEIFSRHSRVEKASGETVSLKEYLEHVWAAVAKEALAQVFKDADTFGFESDARITAMWLWTLTGGVSSEPSDDEESNRTEDEDGETPKKPKPKGFVLEFDAARKIAQGLGATLENLSSVIEVKGDTARLLPVSERAAALFGKDAGQTPAIAKKKKDKQLKLGLFDELIDEAQGEVAWKEKVDAKLGETTLDRVHQSMILFAAGRGEAIKRFLVDDGAGQDQRFWKLAQALSALYPSSSDEKRWVDGVLARKRGLGL